MKRHCITVVAVICLLAVGGFVRAKSIHSKAGTSVFPFLKINLGARAVAMGGAFTGLADDETALYYNPAGIAFLDDRRFVAGYHNYFADMQSGFLGLTSPLGERLRLGGWVSYLNYGEFIKTDSSGEITGDFSGGDILAAVTLAVKQSYNIAVGGTVKLIYERVHDYSASGVAVDLAVKYSSDLGRFGAGLMIQNLGKQLSALGTEKYRLPLVVRGGVSERPRAFPLTIVSDVIVPVDNDVVVAVGADYYELRPFYARIGWSSFGSNYRAADSDDTWAGLSLGVDFDYNNLHIAYAYSPSADLGQSHRVTLTGGF